MPNQEHPPAQGTGIGDSGPTRRTFLRTASAAVALTGLTRSALARQRVDSEEQNVVTLSQIHAASEQPEQIPGPFAAPDQRIGFAIVGLGRLALGQILPAMGKSKYCKATALVSGDRNKAHKIAAQYGIRDSSVYDYSSYEMIAENPEVQVIYIVLPNSMHAEFVIRGAKLGKHVLCEKPMATNVQDCERMIEACRIAQVKLMIAYRSQYEPNDLELVRLIREGKLGKLKQIIATNTQDQGDPNQWRLKRKLAGGGCMPDVGIYCLNAARFLSEEEPSEIMASLYQPIDDPRFAEVEASCQVIAKFPSGMTAVFNSGYDGHKSQFLRVEGAGAWAELNPAFSYSGIKLRYKKLQDDMDIVIEPSIEEKDQFAAEMDHMAICVKRDLIPHTPGEEGLQDQRITDAIYESAMTGRAVRLSSPPGTTRGPTSS